MAQDEPLASEISEISCSIEQPCPEALECFSFPEIGTRCAQPNPCSYYQCPEGMKCLVGEIYPPIVSCSLIVEEPGMPEYIETAEKAVNLDENIQPADLGLKEPKILPGSPFYVFKDIGRGLTSAFTFNPLARANLKLKFANERVMEVKKLAKLTMAEAPLKPGVLERALDNYKKEMAGLVTASQQIKEKVEIPKVDEFINKFLDQTLKQQKLLGKLEKELPAEAYLKVEEAKKENISGISEIVLGLAEPEVLGEKLVKVMEEQSGSNFKNFKNLEVLKELEAKVPEPAKEAIRQAQKNSLKRLQNNLEEMPEQEREKFKDYVESIGGNEVQHLQVLDVMAAEELLTMVREEIEKAKEKTLERTENRLKAYKEAESVASQETFLKPLGGSGQLEDLRVIKELENNLSPEAIEQIAPAKEAVKEKIAKTLEAATTPEAQKVFLDKIENKFYDVKQLEALKEIEDVIPAPSKEFYEEMKEKILQTMQQEIKKARALGEEAKAVILERVAGDSPEHIEILKEFGVPVEIMPQIAEETIAQISKRAESIGTAERLEGFKQKIEAKEIKGMIQAREPQLLEKVEKRLKEFKALPAPAPAPAVPGDGTGKPAPLQPLDCFQRDNACCRKDGPCAIINILCEPGLEPKITGCDLNCQPVGECLPIGAPPAPLPKIPFIERIEVEAVPVAPAEPTPPLRPAESAPGADEICIQVITPAMGPDGECKNFPTPCDVPDNWKKVEKCPSQ